MKARLSIDFVVTDPEDETAVMKVKKELEAIEDIIKKDLLKDSTLIRFTGTQVRSIPYNKQFETA